MVLIVLGIYNNWTIRPKKAVEKTKKDLIERFDCKDCGDIEEYVGCKVERTKNLLKFTQLVLMQSYNDNFELPKKSYKTPAPAELVLVAGKKEEALSPAMQKKFCSGMEKSHACNAVLHARNIQCSARSVLPHAQGYAGSLQGHGTCT